MAERQPAWYSLGPYPRAEFVQRQRQPGQVLRACLRREINVPGCRYRGLLRDSGEGANDYIADLMPVQRFDYGRGVQFRFTGVLQVTHATSCAGVAWRHA